VGDLKKRVLSALAFGPLVAILFIVLPPGPFLVFMGIVLALAVYELTTMARSGYLPVVIVLAIVGLIPLYAGRHGVYELWLLFSPALYVLFRLIVPIAENTTANKEIGTSVAVLIIAQVFLVFPLFSLYRLKELGRYLPFILLLAIWASDTAAYLLGKSIGRHKLAPLISPKKTLEGLLGAVLGAVLVILLFKNHLGLNMSWAITGGLAIGVLGQLGDIMESIAKRVWEVKDSSSLIPGHGGMLDRIDSILLTAPFMYYYLAGFRG
jgi:phosphatidate cytidylyltransferase